MSTGIWITPCWTENISSLIRSIYKKTGSGNSLGKVTRGQLGIYRDWSDKGRIIIAYEDGFYVADGRVPSTKEYMRLLGDSILISKKYGLPSSRLLRVQIAKAPRKATAREA